MGEEIKTDMNPIRNKLDELKDQSLDELVILTKDFLKLADTLYDNNKLSENEYYELTHTKKQFLNSLNIQ
ncbi:MAG: hypothetical protein AB9856_11110 [Cellulosilyticaceae bacterium]